MLLEGCEETRHSMHKKTRRSMIRTKEINTETETERKEK
jgi:hypothetical protein